MLPYQTKVMLGGVQKLYRFENGYGASVIKHMGSYGHEDGLWELAVIKWKEGTDEFALCYDTTITSDVVGYLTDDGVEKILLEIEFYPL